MTVANPYPPTSLPTHLNVSHRTVTTHIGQHPSLRAYPPNRFPRKRGGQKICHPVPFGKWALADCGWQSVHVQLRQGTRCNALQHSATYCNILIDTATHCNMLCHTTTHCSILQHIATHFTLGIAGGKVCMFNVDEVHAGTRCNTLQHTAAHYNTLQHPAAHCNTLQHTTTPCTALHHSATHCNNTLQHTATHWNALQHTTTHCSCRQGKSWVHAFRQICMWILTKLKNQYKT